MQSDATHAELLATLLQSEGNVFSATQQISAILRTLVANASHRIEAVLRLEGFRNERDAIRQLELLVQERSRDQLAQARREVDHQAEWAAEVRECLERAEADGIARGALLGPSGTVVDPDDDGVAETRVLIYRMQLAQLAALIHGSEARMHTLLSRLRIAQSTSTTRAELIRLQSHANAATVWLSELSVDRVSLGRELKKLEAERMVAEGRRAGLVLDLVLRWAEGRRDEWSGVEVQMARLVV